MIKKLLPALSKESQPHRWFELNWPLELDAKQMSAWLQALSGQYSCKDLRFVTNSSTSGIKHYLVLPESNYLLHTQLIKTFLPDIEINETEPLIIQPKLNAKLLLTSRNRVLQTKYPEIISNTILSSLTTLSSNEQITLNWHLGKRQSPKELSGIDKISSSSNPLRQFVESLLYEPTKLDAQALTSLRDKVGNPGWKANLYIGIQANTRRRRSMLLSRVLGVIKIAEAPGVRVGIRLTTKKVFTPGYKPLFWPLTLNYQELTGLVGFPLGSSVLSGISRITSRHLALSEAAPNYGKVVAQTRDGAKIRLSTQDSLLHSHILGPTGVGKSTLLLNLVTQDIKANKAVIVVDPKGDLIQDILSRIPEERINDVIVLDPSDSSLPVGLNPLSNSQSPSLVADNILSIFKGLYSSYFGPRTQDILHSGLLTLAKNKDTNLCMLPLLYTNPEFRRSMVSKLNDPLGLGTFWNWYDGLSEAERMTVTAPVMNKIRPFLLRPAMRRVIGQSSPKLDIAEALNSNKILLINLAKGTLGSETSQLFGSLVVSQIWQAIQTRANVPTGQRKPAFVYIDEVQDYLHLPTDIGDVLAQSRSYGVGLTLAHQHLGQLPTDLRAGILANARNTVCFQLSHEDAFAMAKSSNMLTPGDFENLQRPYIPKSIVFVFVFTIQLLLRKLVFFATKPDRTDNF